LLAVASESARAVLALLAVRPPVPQAWASQPLAFALELQQASMQPAERLASVSQRALAATAWRSTPAWTDKSTH